MIIKTIKDSGNNDIVMETFGGLTIYLENTQANRRLMNEFNEAMAQEEIKENSITSQKLYLEHLEECAEDIMNRWE